MDLWPTLQGILTVIATGALLGALAAINARRKATFQAGLDRIIYPNRPIFLGLALCGLILAAGMAYGAYYSFMTFRYSQTYWLVPAALAFALMAWTMTAYVLFPVYNVRWDHDGLSGPSSYWFPPFGPGAATIAFDDIVDSGTDWGDSFFVRDATGRQIKFSYLYKGYPQLLDALAEARPDLFPDEDDWDDDDWFDDDDQRD